MILRIVLDTNILLRFINQKDPLHPEVAAALRRFLLRGGVAYLTIQTVMEFWAVATRPATVNGLGLSVPETRQHVNDLVSGFPLLSDPTDVLERWLELCTHYVVKGLPSHDARLVAVMESHGMTELLTLNPGDFKRYPGVRCLSLDDL